MKRLKLLVIAAFLTLSGFAQHDIKLNITNVFLYEFNVNYEYLLNEYATLGGFGGYAYGFPGVEEPNKYFYVGPEFRYYVSPKNGADRFFIGLYSRVKVGSSYLTQTENGTPINDPFGYLSYYQTEEVDYFKLGLGVSLGGKWVTKTGFVYGVFGGIGRNVVSNYDETAFVNHESEFNPDSYYKDTYSDYDTQYWDFRIGFNVGWRLGK